MFRICIILALLLAGTSASAAEITTGRFKCNYRGDWACGDAPDSICIDSVRRGIRATLKLDLDKRRINLDGLKGSLVREDSQHGYEINWQIGAFNFRQRLELSDSDDDLVAKVVSGTDISEFSCKEMR